jgi:site-specific DNA-methyltransferase (adenine-specific)
MTHTVENDAGPKPYYEDDRATLYHGDALAVLAELPTSSVDALITDPPYFLPASHYSTRTGSFRSLADLSMLEHFFRDAFHEFARILRPTGVAYVFCDGQSYPAFYAVAFERFPKVRPIIWDKQTSINGYAWRHQHELILFAERPEAPKVPTGDGDIIAERAVPIGDREHLAQKPVPLLRRLVQKTKPGGVVLDPFMGSASTGVAALIEGRRFVGVEMGEHYAEVAANRLRTVARGYRDDGQQDALDLDGGAA